MWLLLDRPLVLVPAPHARVDLRDDGGVVVDFRRGTVFSLNVLGAAVWRALATGEGVCVSQVQRAVRGACPDGPAQLEADVAEFLRVLVAQGLVRRVRHWPFGPSAKLGGRHAQAMAGTAEVVHPASRSQDTATRPDEPTPSLSLLLAMTTLAACDVVQRVAGVSALRWCGRMLDRVPVCPRSTTAVESAGAMVDRASAYYYKHAWCLHRSVAKAFYLRLHGVPAAVVIGYRTMPFFAHAWVEVDGRVVTERQQVKELLREIDRF